MQVVFSPSPDGSDPALAWEPDYAAPWRDAAAVAALPPGAWDGPVVRLARYEAAPPRMVLQRARYFDYIGTNLSPHACERTHAIGLAALLFTADGLCILQQRDTDLAIRPGMLGPSMSGTLEPSDLVGVTRLSQLDARREIREELGVTNAEIADLSLLALIREPERGGAPELMFRGHLQLTADALRRRTQTEGTLVFADPKAVSELPRRCPPLDNLLQLLRERP